MHFILEPVHIGLSAALPAAAELMKGIEFPQLFIVCNLILLTAFYKGSIVLVKEIGIPSIKLKTVNTVFFLQIIQLTFIPLYRGWIGQIQ